MKKELILNYFLEKFRILLKIMKNQQLKNKFKEFNKNMKNNMKKSN